MTKCVKFNQLKIPKRISETIKREKRVKKSAMNEQLKYPLKRQDSN